MISPEAERTPLDMEEESRFSDVVMREFHHANPERELENAAAEKLDNLISALIGKKGINNYSDSLAKDSRNLHALIKTNDTFISYGESNEPKSSKDQQVSIWVIPPTDTPHEKQIIQLFESSEDYKDENPVGELWMTRDEDGKLTFTARGQGDRQFDWYGIIDDIYSKVMSYKPRKP